MKKLGLFFVFSFISLFSDHAMAEQMQPLAQQFSLAQQECLQEASRNTGNIAAHYSQCMSRKGFSPVPSADLPANVSSTYGLQQIENHNLENLLFL